MADQSRCSLRCQWVESIYGSRSVLLMSARTVAAIKRWPANVLRRLSLQFGDLRSSPSRRPCTTTLVLLFVLLLLLLRLFRGCCCCYWCCCCWCYCCRRYSAIVAIVVVITASADITVVVDLAVVVVHAVVVAIVPAATAFAIAAIVGETITFVVVCYVDW